MLLVALLCLGFQLKVPAVLPSEADYAQVQAVLEAEAQAGDALLVFPWWAERARLFAPERLTVVGYQGSDADSLELHPRVWVLAQPDLPKASWSSFWSVFGAGRTAIGSERVFGRLHLSLYQNGRFHPTRFSLADALSTAQVYVEGPDGSRLPCSFDGRAHRCGGGNYVAVELHEVRFQPRRCVRLYPPGGQGRLVVEWSNVPAADQVALLGGFIWDRGYFHEDRIFETHLQLEVNGVKAAAIDYPKGRFGLQRAEGPAVPPGSTLRVWSQAQSAELRELCVEVYGFGAGATP
ncbi:MAG: hypothetical protein IPJ65_06080 [Archangiaceae bacterium]|nr:hypothetical protein [Archangiaceae bacterium]